MFLAMQAIGRFVKESPVGSTITLITSDGDFAPELAKAKASLQGRMNQFLVAGSL